MYSNQEYKLPTPQSPGQPGLWDRSEQYASEEEAYTPPGYDVPSPFGAPIKSADPVTVDPPVTIQPPRTTVVTPPKKAKRSGKGKTDSPQATSDWPVSLGADKRKKGLSMPSLSMPTMNLGIPAPAQALGTPLACSIAGWLIISNLSEAGTQGMIAIAIMSLAPIILLWFFLSFKMTVRTKLGVMATALLLVAIAFSSLATIAPYSILALTGYCLYYPALRGHLRRAATWFTASAIAWSITIWF